MINGQMRKNEEFVESPQNLLHQACCEYMSSNLQAQPPPSSTAADIDKILCHPACRVDALSHGVTALQAS